MNLALSSLNFSTYSGVAGAFLKAQFNSSSSRPYFSKVSSTMMLVRTLSLFSVWGISIIFFNSSIRSVRHFIMAYIRSIGIYGRIFGSYTVKVPSKSYTVWSAPCSMRAASSTSSDILFYLSMSLLALSRELFKCSHCSSTRSWKSARTETGSWS